MLGLTLPRELEVQQRGVQYLDMYDLHLLSNLELQQTGETAYF